MTHEFQFGKIGLIKLLRMMANVSLKEAKNASDFALSVAEEVGENDEAVIAGAILIVTNDLRRAVELSSRTYFQCIALHMIDNPPEGGFFLSFSQLQA